MIIVYNLGVFRNQGLGSLAGMLPFGNANEIAFQLGKEVIRVMKKTPVIIGLCGTDPSINIDGLLDEAIDMGFCGIHNYPTVGLINGNFRISLEQTGLSYDKEVALIARAHQKGLLTTPLCFHKG